MEKNCRIYKRLLPARSDFVVFINGNKNQINFHSWILQKVATGPVRFCRIQMDFLLILDNHSWLDERNSYCEGATRTRLHETAKAESRAPQMFRVPDRRWHGRRDSAEGSIQVSREKIWDPWRTPPPLSWEMRISPDPPSLPAWEMWYIVTCFNNTYIIRAFLLTIIPKYSEILFGGMWHMFSIQFLKPF